MLKAKEREQKRDKERKGGREEGRMLTGKEEKEKNGEEKLEN